MKMVSQLPAAVCLAIIAGGVGCRESKKNPEVVNVAQDTMLLRDLAEANKNTASAAAMDNSLNTIRTSGGDSLQALVNAAAQPRTVVRPSPSDSEVLTSGSRLTPPLRANDAPSPTTVPTELSPASGSSGDPCASPVAADQRSCLNRAIVQYDAELNRTYQDLLAQSRKSGGPELEQRFRQSQRDWANQRDAECRGVGEGALWARERARCLGDQSDRRTAELRRNLNSLRGQ
jgi:uncharacterized protein YecT (DUF1311 family)